MVCTKTVLQANPRIICVFSLCAVGKYAYYPRILSDIVVKSPNHFRKILKKFKGLVGIYRYLPYVPHHQRQISVPDLHQTVFWIRNTLDEHPVSEGADGGAGAMCGALGNQSVS